MAHALETASPLPPAAREHTDARQSDGGSAAVDRHLAAALTAARRSSHTDLATNVGRIAGHLSWTQTAAYVSAPPYPTFLDHYAHAALLGPADLEPMLVTRSADVRLGLLLLGPVHTYPPHAHPAEEIYLPLTRARWTKDSGPSQLLSGGTLIYHPPEVTHGVQTGQDPLIAVYLWLGDTRTSSRFTDTS